MRCLASPSAGIRWLRLAEWPSVSNSGSIPAAMFMRILAGLLLICMGLYLAGWWSGLTRIESLGRGLWRNQFHHLGSIFNVAVVDGAHYTDAPLTCKAL